MRKHGKTRNVLSLKPTLKIKESYIHWRSVCEKCWYRSKWMWNSDGIRNLVRAARNPIRNRVFGSNNWCQWRNRKDKKRSPNLSRVGPKETSGGGSFPRRQLIFGIHFSFYFLNLTFLHFMTHLIYLFFLIIVNMSVFRFL